VDLSGDVPSVHATVTDGDRRVDVLVSGLIKFDGKEWVIRLSEPQTKTSGIYRGNEPKGEIAAEFVPEMEGRIDKDWKGTKKVVGAIEGATKWLTRSIGSLASGDFVSDMQFPGQAKRVVWDMPLMPIPESDRLSIEDGSVSSIAMLGGAIVVSVERWDMNVLTSISIILIFVGAGLLIALLYSPAFLSE